MHARADSRSTTVALAVAGLLFLLCGAGWALYGRDIFLASLMAGLAGCL